MSTTEIIEGAGAAAPTEQTPPPEQKTGDAPQTDEAADAGQSSSSEDEDKGLTDEQKTIRKQARRIDRLTAKRGAAEREAELLRQEIAKLSSRQGDEPRTEGNEGKGYSAADIERIANERAATLHQQRSIGERVSKVLKDGSKIEGFNAAVDAVAEVVPFTDRQGRPTAFVEAVLDTDNPAALLKYLGENPDEADDLANLSPAQLGRRLAKLEDRLKQEATKKTSAAPKPLAPVSGANAGNSTDPSKMTDKQFAAWRRSQIKERRA